MPINLEWFQRSPPCEDQRFYFYNKSPLLYSKRLVKDLFLKKASVIFHISFPKSDHFSIPQETQDSVCLEHFNPLIVKYN